MAGADPLQERQVKGTPEVGPLRDIAESTTVLAIGTGSYQGDEVAPLGALDDLIVESIHVHARLLGIGQVPITDDDHDLILTVARDIARAPQDMACDAQPALQLLVPVRLRDQGQHRMVKTGPQDLKQLLVLEMPQQRAAVDDAINPLLKPRIVQHLQQGPGQG